MIIAICQHKGGTGKTSTTLNLGAALAEQGYRVLLVDLDPQADLSAGLGVEVDTKRTVPNLYTVLSSDEASIADIITETQWRGLAIAPGTLDMADLEAYLTTQIGRERVLEEALEPVAGNFDFILLDCPPSLGLITVNALLAAQAVLIPVQAEPRSVRATERTLGAIKLVQRKLKRPDLRVLGLLLTMTGPNNIARESSEVLRSTYGDAVLATTIQRRVRMAEDVLYKAPVLAYAPKSEPAGDFRALAEEVLTRVSPQELRREEITHAG